MFKILTEIINLLSPVLSYFVFQIMFIENKTPTIMTPITAKAIKYRVMRSFVRFHLTLARASARLFCFASSTLL